MDEEDRNGIVTTVASFVFLLSKDLQVEWTVARTGTYRAIKSIKENGNEFTDSRMGMVMEHSLNGLKYSKLGQVIVQTKSHFSHTVTALPSW